MTASNLRISVIFALVCSSTLAAQAGEAPAPIQDNSFLLEEAYNQEAGVVQHIGALQRGDEGEGWEAGVTQEWPLFSPRHQLSYTIPVVHPGDGFSAGLGDVSVDYRYQLVGNASARVAVAPRVSVLLATGDEDAGRGGGRAGAELGLPVSIVLSPVLVAHTNAAFAVFPDDAGDATQLTLAQSVIWLAHPRVNLMLEAAWERFALDAGGDAESLVVSPGVRTAFNAGSAQIVPGIAVPIGVGASSGERALLLYLSVEHPFLR